MPQELDLWDTEQALTMLLQFAEHLPKVLQVLLSSQHPASSFRSVSSVPAGCAWMVGGSLMVQEDLKNAVPSSSGGQYSTLMICITIMCLGYVIHHFYFTFTYCLKQPSIYVHQKYAEKKHKQSVHILCTVCSSLFVQENFKGINQGIL